jgi:sugar phosphate permease
MGSLAPFLIESFTLTNAQIGIVGVSVNAGMMFTAILAGKVVDLRGEKVVLVGGGLLTGLGALLASRSGTFEWLVVLLFFTGLWASASTPAGGKAVMTWFPYNKRGFVLGIRQTGVPIGGLAAALTLPLIAMKYGWQGAMVGMGIVAIIGSIVSQITLKDNFDKQTKNVNISRKSGEEWAVLRNKDVWLVSLTAITYVSAQATLVTYLVVFLHIYLGKSIVIAGFLMALAQLSGASGRIVLGIVSDTVFHGFRKPVLVISGTLAALMSLAMIFINSSTPLWVIGIIIGLFGFSAIGWNGIYAAFMAEIVGKEQAGTALGLGLSLVQIGVLFFPPTFGLIVDYRGNYTMSWVVLSLLVFAGVLILSLVHETEKS